MNRSGLLLGISTSRSSKLRAGLEDRQGGLMKRHFERRPISLRGLALSASCLFALIYFTPGRATSRQIQIQDLVAVEERGLPAREFAAAFGVNAGTLPNAVTSGTYPSSYTSGSYPSQVTSGNSPSILTRGTSPSRYVSGSRLVGGTATDFPMPKLNF